MNGYEVQIWYSVEHNGEFQFNNRRYEIVHAFTEEAARRMVELKPEKITEIPGLTIKVSRERIYCVKYLGKVTYETKVVYKKEGANEHAS